MFGVTVHQQRAELDRRPLERVPLLDGLDDVGCLGHGRMLVPGCGEMVRLAVVQSFAGKAEEERDAEHLATTTTPPAGVWGGARRARSPHPGTRYPKIYNLGMTYNSSKRLILGSGLFR